jgi:hypothetical protein
MSSLSPHGIHNNRHNNELDYREDDDRFLDHFVISNLCLKLASPYANRDFTVPTGISSTAAVSTSDSSCK